MYGLSRRGGCTGVAHHALFLSSNLASMCTSSTSGRALTSMLTPSNSAALRCAAAAAASLACSIAERMVCEHMAHATLLCVTLLEHLSTPAYVSVLGQLRCLHCKLPLLCCC